MRAREAYVHMHLGGEFILAGRLRHYEDGRFSRCLFEYTNRYLDRKDAVPVDPVQLPLRKEHTFEGPEGGTLFGGIRDACPDDWGRHVLDTAAEGSGFTLSEFDYMLYAGPDRVGALGFSLDPGSPAFSDVPKWTANLPGTELDLEGMLEAADTVEAAESLSPSYRRFFVRGSSALGGARPKASVEMEGQQWIAKFSKEREAWPTCRIEQANLELAGLCGIEVPATRRVTVFGDRDIFLIQRFDRDLKQKHSQRIPFVSAMTLTGRQDLGEPTSYGDIVTAMRRDFYQADTVREDIAQLYRRMAFNVFCNNSDDHARNHGFLFDMGSRRWRLSPAYDVVPQPVMEDSARMLHLGIGPEGRIASISNLRAAGRAFGLSEDRVSAILEEVRGTIRQNWERVYAGAGVAQRHFNELRNCFDLALNQDVKSAPVEVLPSSPRPRQG
ncbi:type II toxin-antitoxin system HipA family toxin [uncultured Desulfovibrio sp.]|uniref:type II toxin-antitoxin system HipA family toxin n=1 Tax=uncultured Desulfovibrio sp. TaxID=167968 RepID=UPI00267226A8|nr:HipA domain-containing protein [uncultured Desulfovibrio sp.]